MKKIFRIKVVLELSISLLLLLLIGGCTKQNERFKVGFLTHTLADERWGIEQDIFTKHIESFGGDVICKNANNDERLQYHQAQQMVEDGIDVLVIVPVNSNSAGSIARLCQKNNVKIIAYDIIIDKCDLDLYVSFDNVRVGELMAEYAVKRKPRGNYVVFYGDGSMRVAHWIKEGMENILTPIIEDGNISISYQSYVENWSAESAQHKMTRVLEFSNTDVDAILASSDGIASGVIAAFNGCGMKNTPILTGQDASRVALRSIQDGKQSMSVSKPFKDLARVAADAAYAMVQKTTVEVDTQLNNGCILVPTILLDPGVVNHENLHAYMEETQEGNKQVASFH